MPLSTGDKLGPYEIVAPIGAGGMGEVYRASDTRLGRDVAIKVSHEQFSERFEREAKSIAALNHPNICHLYDVGPNYLVMELVNGETLKGPLPLKEALKIAGQIADALEAAHERGIIHRDLKPANVKIALDGTAKVLDFGLAKNADVPAGDPRNSPTMTMSPTRAGTILGTAAYMAPEQASGKLVDKRADIWAFGVVLYEIMTGHRLFSGDTPTEILASVLKEEPDLSGIPAEVRPLIESCLEKDPRKRLRDIGDMKLLLRLTAQPTAPKIDAPRTWLWSGIAAAILVTVAAVGWTRALRPNPATGMAFSVLPPPGLQLSMVGGLGVDRISPDGFSIVHRAQPATDVVKFENVRHYLRNLGSLESQPLPDWIWSGDVFWAPDSKSIAFPVGAQLMKMRLPNGAQERIASMDGAERGGSWGEKGTIIFGQGPLGLFSTPASGGTPQRLEVPGLTEGGYFNPEFLPGGEDFLFSFLPDDANEGQVFLATLRDGKVLNPQKLLENDTAAAFTPAGDGRLLFIRKDNLYSQRLDVKARKLAGDPELVQDHVASLAWPEIGYFSVSRTGTVAWRSGTGVRSQVTVFDRKGNKIGVSGVAGGFTGMTLSPDESRLVVSSGGRSNVTVVDANGAGARVLSLGFARSPIWSHDGTRLIFSRRAELWESPADGSGPIHKLAGIPNAVGAIGIQGAFPDGMRILFGDRRGGVFAFSLDGRGSPEQVFAQASDTAALSPDSRWIVYVPRSEPGIYAQPISAGSLPKQIASTGYQPVWRGDGKEILYSDFGSKARIMSVRVDASGGTLRFGTPELLFTASLPMGLTSGSHPLAVNRDGSRIYFLQSVEQPQSGVIQVRTDAIK